MRDAFHCSDVPALAWLPLTLATFWQVRRPRHVQGVTLLGTDGGFLYGEVEVSVDAGTFRTTVRIARVMLNAR